MPTPELLAALAAEPLPLGLGRLRGRRGSSYRDVYVDTSDNALAARGIACRIRYGADDRRTHHARRGRSAGLPVAGRRSERVRGRGRRRGDLAAILARRQRAGAAASRR